ncbi:hypothetical protein D3C87_1998830 [compost metagenome]
MSSRDKLNAVIHHFQGCGTNGLADNAECMGNLQAPKGLRQMICNSLHYFSSTRIDDSVIFH